MSQLLYDQLKNAGFIAGDHTSATNTVTRRSLAGMQTTVNWDIDRASFCKQRRWCTMSDARREAKIIRRSLQNDSSARSPVGYSARELDLAAMVARYHRGALPRPRGKTHAATGYFRSPMATLLVAILRLAVALVARRQQKVRQRNVPSPDLPSSSRRYARPESREKRLEVQISNDQIVVRLERAIHHTTVRRKKLPRHVSLLEDCAATPDYRSSIACRCVAQQNFIAAG